MVSDPDTVVRKVLDSQQSGATAVVTAEAQVPMIAATLSTSMSLRAARTAASGLVWSSSLASSILRPSTPPAAFTSPTTHSIARRMGGPYGPPAPVSGVKVPRRMAPPCARASRGARAAAPSAVAPASTARREMRVESSLIVRSPRGPRPRSVEILSVAVLQPVLHGLDRHVLRAGMVVEHLSGRGQPGEVGPLLRVPQPRALHALRAVEEALLHLDGDGELRQLALDRETRQHVGVAHDLSPA